MDRLQSFFHERPELGVASVYLFGGRGMGRHWDRILGLAVLLDSARHPDRMRRAKLLEELAPDLAEAAGETRIDLVVLNDAPPLAGRRICREGRRLLCPDPAVDRQFLRDVQVRAVDVEAFLRRPRRPRLEAVLR